MPETSTRFGSGTRCDTLIGCDIDAEKNVDAISHVNSVVNAIAQDRNTSGKWVRGSRIVWMRLEIGWERENKGVFRKCAVNGLRSCERSGTW